MPINDRATLLKSFTAAVDLAIKTVPELKILCGGHSMSALVATVADATEILPVSGVIAMGYPRKGDPELSAHIPDTHSRLLVIQGTNDDLGSVEEIAMMAKTTNTPATIKWIENADHKFDVPGQPRASVAQDIATSIRQFSDAI